jgi:single-strand binding protein
MNKVILVGRLSRDPQLRVSANQKKVCNYTLAVDRPQQKGQERSADFISCVCFDKMAEFAAQSLAKGVKMAIVGHLHTRSYVDEKTNTTVYVTEVIVESQEFVESKEVNKKYKAASQAPAQQQYDPYAAQQQYQQPVVTQQPQQPVYQQPVYQAPVQQVPVQQAQPMYQQPVAQQQPVYQQPAQVAPEIQPAQMQPTPDYGLNLGADDLPF